MEVLNEGCSLCVLVPAAMVSCSSSAYWLCNCYYFFLSLTLLFFYSPLCDFSVLHAYVPVNVFNFCNLLKRLRKRRKYPTEEIAKRRKYPKRLRNVVNTPTFTRKRSSRNVFTSMQTVDVVIGSKGKFTSICSRSRLQFFTSSFCLSILQHIYVHVFNSSRRPRNS